MNNQVKEIVFTGPDGKLVGKYKKGQSLNPPVALILHPHPLYGGTMNNPVVLELFNIFDDLGFSTFRFNFRGVGKSEGKFDNGLGELADAAAGLDWVQRQNPNANQCWVAGFSFGALLCMQLLMRRPEITRFISVSPQPNLYDFNFLAPCPASGMIIQGKKDELVPIEGLLWIDKCQPGIAQKLTPMHHHPTIPQPATTTKQHQSKQQPAHHGYAF